VARPLTWMLLLFASVSTAGPVDDYLASHPEVQAEDLLMVGFGDSLERVLAVLDQPEAGARSSHLRLLEVVHSVSRPLGLDSPAARNPAPEAALILSVSTRCPGNPAGTSATAVDSWFHLRGGRLVAWSFQPYSADCQPETPLFHASDHGAMQVVGEHLFRPAGRGRFRYGPLRYERWDNAFAAPSREAMLSLLRSRARPGDARSYNRLAVGLHGAGDRAGALVALEEAARIDPTWGLPHANLAVVYLQRGDLGAARSAAARAESLAVPPVGSGPPP